MKPIASVFLPERLSDLAQQTCPFGASSIEVSPEIPIPAVLLPESFGVHNHSCIPFPFGSPFGSLPPLFDIVFYFVYIFIIRVYACQDVDERDNSPFDYWCFSRIDRN